MEASHVVGGTCAIKSLFSSICPMPLSLPAAGMPSLIRFEKRFAILSFVEEFTGADGRLGFATTEVFL